MTLHWLDFAGERTSVGDLEPGESRFVWTFMPLAWLIADEEDECISIHLPTEDAGIVTAQ